MIQLIVSASQSLSRSDETEIGKVIKDKFNIVFEYLPVNDDAEKQSLMLATGDFPEILRLEGNDMVQDYVKAGALVGLDDYIASSTFFNTSSLYVGLSKPSSSAAAALDSESTTSLILKSRGYSQL